LSRKEKKMANALEVILEQIEELAREIKNRAYSKPGEKIKFGSATDLERDEIHAGLRKPLEQQLIALCKTLSKITIPMSQRERVIKIIQVTFDNWPNTFQDALNDFFHGLAVLAGCDDPDKETLESAKKHLSMLVENLNA
jgi:hypothetical protein